MRKNADSPFVVKVRCATEASHPGNFCRMVLQEGFFNKTCAMYPLETNEESPLKSMTPLIDSPMHGVPVRVTEDTTMWQVCGSKIAKPHSCYLAKFDHVPSVGIIFLGTSAPFRRHMFVGIHGGVEPTFGTLTTIPPAAFNKVFYLNLSHPLRVALIYLPPPTSLNTLRTNQLGLDGRGGPPEVGITTIMSRVPGQLISLDAISTDTFWKLHKAYHMARPRRRSSLGLDGGLAGGGGGGVPLVATGVPVGAPLGSAGVGVGGSAEVVGPTGGIGGMGGGRLAWGSAGLVEGATADAPWGKIGHLRIGIDLCCVMDDFSDESDEESLDEAWELEQEPFGLDGRLVVCDFPTSTFVEGASVMGAF